jgi:hypothetical protein
MTIALRVLAWVLVAAVSISLIYIGVIGMIAKG